MPYLPPIGSGTDYRILRVRDLSAGGCCCETTDDWPGVGSHLTGYLYLDDARGPLELDLLVLRRQTSELESRPPESDVTLGSDGDDSSECSREEAETGPETGSEVGSETGSETVTLVAFRFLEMRESKRQRIMRALFREFRRERRQSDPS